MGASLSDCERRHHFDVSHVGRGGVDYSSWWAVLVSVVVRSKRTRPVVGTLPTDLGVFLRGAAAARGRAVLAARGLFGAPLFSAAAARAAAAAAAAAAEVVVVVVELVVLVVLVIAQPAGPLGLEPLARALEQLEALRRVVDVLAALRRLVLRRVREGVPRGVAARHTRRAGRAGGGGRRNGRSQPTARAAAPRPTTPRRGPVPIFQFDDRETPPRQISTVETACRHAFGPMGV